MSSADSDPDELRSLWRRIDSVQGTDTSAKISSSDLTVVVRSFGGSNHNLAYGILTSLCTSLREHQRSKISDQQATESISRLFIPFLEDGFRATIVDEARGPLLLLIALLQLDNDVGTYLLLREGTIQWLEELLELFPHESSVIQGVCTALSIAGGSKKCQNLIRERFLSWLEARCQNPKDERTSASAAVALAKLSRVQDDASATPLTGDTPATVRSKSDEELAHIMKSIITKDRGNEVKEGEFQAVIDSVEGLAYLTDATTIKESLAADAEFLRRLFSLVPSIKRGNNLIARKIDESPEARANASLIYGICVIILQFVQYAPRLTEEEGQIQKLRKLAISGNLQRGEKSEERNTGDDERESDEVVASRGKRLISAGVLPVLATLARSESAASQQAVGQSYLSLVQPKENRGAVLQSGGGKAILSIIGHFLAPSSSSLTKTKTTTSGLPVQALPTIQALAKLAITTDPRILFGPSETGIFDAIRPLKQLLLHQHSSLLQKFESLMALTNLASTSQTAAQRIATDDVISQMDSLILDNHPLIRRAANELLCNIVATEGLLKRYGADVEATAVPPKGVISRMHILLALSDSEDLATRKAASGTLATLLSISPLCVKSLLSVEKGPQGVLAILGDLIDPSRSTGRDSSPLLQNDTLQLAHRGVVCFKSIFDSEKDASMERKVLEAAKTEKLAPALVSLIKSISDGEPSRKGGSVQGILFTAAECLKWLTDKGL
ncbi:armadillo-type protein [Cantharellus anzutake]|uniref:armadillo-type protein n=1 Tax=Cantharellus anzutake TaxID=1750568 RepID=UPI001902F0FD|nr:armadillo-type protein [Cantharellus anzutake]KAF8330782.1 armadillo-type protein [Cantharellus anzutake]